MINSKHFFRFLSLTVLLHLSMLLIAQYPPAVGQEGTTAIYMDSTIIKGWATDCLLNRGLMDLSQPDLGYPTYGVANDAIGIANNMVVSLGDGGTALLSFLNPIGNGDGADFVVYENAFSDEFLELAFVEVSSDGQHFVRFPAHSLTQQSEQVETFGTLNTSLLHNLAGKYRAFYGTPFDLEELIDSLAVNIDSINFVRIVDVVGSINPEFASYDSQGNIVNDPWPTPFPQSGFDLDGVAVIHYRNASGITEESQRIAFYPNPTTGKIYFNNTLTRLVVRNIAGVVVYENRSNLMYADLGELSPGVYILTFSHEGATTLSSKLIVQ